MSKYLLPVIMLVVMAGCTGSKQRVKLDAAVGEIVKAVNVGVQAGYIDPAKQIKLQTQIDSGYSALGKAEAEVAAAKAAYEAAKAQ